MARPLRVEYPGAHYHVINRGNQRQIVFRSDADHELFLDKLWLFASQFGVNIMSYCLMPNHFHLYLATPSPNLSRFMQALLTSFTITLNRRRRSSGHLFQGRFKAVPVESEQYGSELSRYIHLNPIRTVRARALPLEDKRRLLVEYRWSSFAVLVGLRGGPDALYREGVLCRWGKTAQERHASYRRYVEEGLTADIADPMEMSSARAVLGSEPFVDRIRRLLHGERYPAEKGEELERKRMLKSFGSAEVLAVVSRVMVIPVEEIVSCGRRHVEARRFAMRCVCEYCRHGESLGSLAKRFGVSVSGPTRARDRVIKEAAKNKHVAKTLEKIHDALLSKKSTAQM